MDIASLIDGGNAVQYLLFFGVSILLHFVKGPWRSTSIEMLKALKKNPDAGKYLEKVELDEYDYPEDN